MVKLMSEVRQLNKAELAGLVATQRQFAEAERQFNEAQKALQEVVESLGLDPKGNYVMTPEGLTRVPVIEAVPEALEA